MDEQIKVDRLLLRPGEVGPLTGLSRAMVYKLLASGDLPQIRVGRSVRVPRRALESWVEKNTTGGEHAA